ncbi:MAG: YceI family protein [Bacteroidia bacterium]
MRVLSIVTITLFALMALAFKPAGKVFFQNQSGEIKFFSTAPLEDITALNHKSSALLKTEDGSLTVKVPIRAFEFEKDLMYQHFLEKKYMWAEKHPEAELKAKITNLGEIDFDKDGTYNASVQGNLSIRGVSKEYTFNGKITVKGDNVKCDSKFDVKLEDHEVPIPRMVTENIAEVVEVTVNLDLDKYEKKKE